MVVPLASHVELLNPLALLTGNDSRDRRRLTIRPAPRHGYLIDGDPSNGELPSLPVKVSTNEIDVSDKPSCPAPPPPVQPGLQLLPLCQAESPSLRDNPDLILLNRQYKSMQASMLAVDDLVGSLIEELESTGALSETVFIFTSNQGWLHGEHRRSGPELPYEEVIAVTLIIRAPGKTTGDANQLALNNDLAPTIAEIAGTELIHHADGTSLVPILADPQTTSWHRRALLVERWFLPNLSKFQGPTSFTLRWNKNGDDYSYISSHTDLDNIQRATAHEFYPLAQDPYQVNSIPLGASVTDALDGRCYSDFEPVWRYNVVFWKHFKWRSGLL